ncbi:hypothetical protein H6P81_000308 [Aristolochia fimbriata]|uniref:Transcription repressor n=1 Tax=Aristolochia fimbriata TaxID=158543 RepID=A0AAV7F675_ARIFI|nr:hypothetical protein H6P81_000308 [Aristolochia fimbriata]
MQKGTRKGMMERRLKLGGISRMFGLSFFSCRNRVDASVMAQDPIFISHRDSHYPDLNPLPPPSTMNRFPSLCRSKKPMITSDQAQNDSKKKLCPPAPPTSPFLNSCCRNNIVMEEEIDLKGKRERKKKKKKRSASKRGDGDVVLPKKLLLRFSPSSPSSSSPGPETTKKKNRVPVSRKENPSKNSSDDAELPHISAGRVLPIKGGFAVVKRSNDPHADFRSSMLEMIMEKQIFGARELEQLLYCFLSLNSPSHHHAILDVFQEICRALFTTWS